MPNPLIAISMPGTSGAANPLAERLAAFHVVAALAGWGRHWGPPVAAAIAASAPVGQGENSGALRDSIAFAGVRATATSMSMRWTSHVSYAAFVVEGTEAHEIHAVVAQALHWVTGGEDGFARSVQHPQTPPNPFPLRALIPLLPRMAESLALLFEEL